MKTYLISLKINESIQEFEIKANTQQEAVNKAKGQANLPLNESSNVQVEGINELLTD